MAHFARLDGNSVVTEVIVVNNDVVRNEPFPASEPIGIEFCQSLHGVDTVWRQTSYNNRFRYHYAGIGFTYDPVLDAFISPKPYPSWVLNTETCDWQAPVPYPNDGRDYYWDEESQSWVLIPDPALVDEPPVAV